MIRRDRNEMVLRARALRRSMTLPEALLWRALRDRPAGYKFRKQHPLGPFVVDFYCASARLVLEVDGESHDMGDNPDRDVQRDDWLNRQNLRVMRIAARDVLKDMDSAVTAIVLACRT